MSKNFLQKVIVTLVTVALLCTAMALTTFAGKIGDLTIDDAKTYEYAAVTVTKANTATDAVVTVAETYTAYETGATLDAGLYAVRETGTTDVGTLVWVSGISETNNYGDILHQVNEQVKDDTTTTLSYSAKDAYTYTYNHPRVWAYTSASYIGAFKPGYWTLYEYTSHGTGRPGYLWKNAQKIYGAGSNVSYLTTEEYRLTIGTYNYSQITSVATLNNRSFTYQYMNDEIIPATDFRSYKFAVGGIGAVATAMTGDVDKLQTKYVLYVINDNFEVEAYTAYATSALTNREFNDITVTLADLKDENGKAITGGYVVGMQVFPYTVPAEGCTVEFPGKPNVAFRMYEDGYKTAYNSATDPVVTADGLTVTIPADAVGTVYQYSAVAGLNAAGTAITKGAYTDMTLDEDTNTYTATLTTGGLYYFKGTASIGTSNEVLVYVEGPAAERKALGVIASGTKFQSTTSYGQFRVGYWTSPDANQKHASSSNSGWSALWGAADSGYVIRPSALYSHFSANTQYLSRHDGELIDLYNAQVAYEAEGGQTEENLATLLAAQTKIIEKFNTKFSAMYAYTTDEFIPANELLGFTYKAGIYASNTGLDYTGDDVKSKAVLYTVNENGAITTYTWTIDLDAFVEPKQGATKTIAFDFTVADDNENTLPADEYVVAMELHPFVGMEKGKTEAGLVKALAEGTSWGAALTLDPAGYDIAIPKISAPTADDFTITDNVVTVNTEYSYKYAQADKDGNYNASDLADVVSGETALTAGYWAFIKVSSDANYGDSDAYILAHVAKATAPAITINRNGYFVLDATAEGYNADFEYEYLMVTDDTDLENLDANTWTALNPTNFQVQEAGETYLVRVKTGDLWTASDYTETKSPKAILLGVSLVLDGQIGIKFTVDAKTGNAGAGAGSYTAGDPYMNMGVTGGIYRCTNKVNAWTYFNDAATYVAGASAAFDYKAETGKCYSTVYVSAKDYNTTTVSFGTWRPTVANDTDNVCWPTKQLPSWGSHTVMSYIESYKLYAEANPDNAEIQAALPLVLALEEYCMNAANYFDDEAEALDEVEAVDADIANAPEKTKDGTLPAGIEFYGTSLMLEDRTQIRYYFTAEEGTAYEVGEDGTTITWLVTLPEGYKDSKLLTNGVIFYESSAITADNLGDSVTKTFATDETSFTVVYSPLNYIADTYSSTNDKTANLAKSLYNYYKAAAAYIVEE